MHLRVDRAVVSLFMLSQANRILSFEKNYKLDILAVVERRLSDEFETVAETKQFFCYLFEQVQQAFDNLPEVNVTVNFGTLSIKRAPNQDYFQDYVWTFNNKTYFNTTAYISFIEYTLRQNDWELFDVAILFTRIPQANPNRLSGEPEWIQLTNLSVKAHPIVPMRCDVAPNVGIMPPDPKIVAYELAYLLGADWPHTILNNQSRFADCKEGRTGEHEHAVSDPTGSFSKCGIRGITEHPEYIWLRCLWEDSIGNLSAQCD